MSTIYNFFFCDIYRLILIIILLSSLFLDIYVLKQGMKSQSDFSLIFIGMLNIMLSSFFGGFAYLINWVDDLSTGHLLFGNGSGFLCQLQSTSIGYFQEVRETFLGMITLLTLLKVKNRFIPRTNTSLMILIIIGYIFPLIITTLIVGNGGYGLSHLFCFTKEEHVGVVWGTVHFIYISINLLVSFISSFSLLLHFCNLNKQLKNDFSASSGDADNFSWCYIFKKILLFPFAQIIFFTVLFGYRILDWFVYTDEDSKESSFYRHIAGIVSIINTLPSLVYTIIFSYSNNLFNLSFDKDEKGDRSVLQEISKINSEE